jgi:hypothetical protein
MESQPVKHRQVVADPQPEYPGPEHQDRPDPVHVDANIHALLQALWAAGYHTQFSCEGWPWGSKGAELYTTRGYILFRRVEDAIDFFEKSHVKSAARGYCCPKLILETAIGMAEDMSYLDEHLPTRGVIRFDHADLKELETLWTS